MNSKLPINSSTPENPIHYQIIASLHPLLPDVLLVQGIEDIMRMARSVKARLRENIEELIAREVAKTVVSKLKSAN